MKRLSPTDMVDHRVQCQTKPLPAFQLLKFSHAKWSRGEANGGSFCSLAEGPGISRDVTVHFQLNLQLRNCQSRVGPPASFIASLSMGARRPSRNSACLVCRS